MDLAKRMEVAFAFPTRTLHIQPPETPAEDRRDARKETRETTSDA